MVNIKKLEKYIGEKIDMSGFTKSQKNKIITGLVQNISVAITIAVFENLNEKYKKEFLKLSELKSKTKILKYVSLKIKNLKLLVSQTTDKTIGEFNELIRASG